MILEKEDGFYFNPKRWLGDAKLIAMDWDCRAMHMHLMCIAWQQDPRGYLPDDEQYLFKLIGSPSTDDWNNRIKKQILSVWKKTNLKVDDGHGKKILKSFYFQPGLIKNLEKSPAKKTLKKNNNLLIDDSGHEGFNLSSLLKMNDKLTILYERANKQDNHHIWNLGVDVLSKSYTPTQSRAYIAKLVKEFGEKAVAEVIAQYTLKKTNPVEPFAYIYGILKNNVKNEQEKKTGTGRGKVSL